MKGNLYFRQGCNNVGKGIEYHDVSALANHLGSDCSTNLLAFHALTGCDVTYPFFRRSKTQAFTMMMNLKNTKNRQISIHLLDTLGTVTFIPNIDEIMDFILHTVYNRPIREKSPHDNRVNMLFTGK